MSVNIVRKSETEFVVELDKESLSELKGIQSIIEAEEGKKVCLAETFSEVMNFGIGEFSSYL